MKTLFRVLGAVAAVAATGAAIVVLDKVLNDKDPLHVENVEFPEEAEKDPAEAEKTAEAYAEGEAKETAPGDAWPPAFEKAPAEEKPAAEETTVNPVEAGPAVAPRDENGKFDTTKIAEASDFTGIEEESGCKS